MCPEDVSDDVQGLLHLCDGACRSDDVVGVDQVGEGVFVIVGGDVEVLLGQMVVYGAARYGQE